MTKTANGTIVDMKLSSTGAAARVVPVTMPTCRANETVVSGNDKLSGREQLKRREGQGEGCVCVLSLENIENERGSREKRETEPRSMYGDREGGGGG